MNIELDRLTDIVSLILKEYPDWRSRGHGSYESVSLSEMIEVIVEAEAQELTMTSPLSVFRSPIDIRSEIFLHGDFGDEGECQYSLPSDFARLYELKMAHWAETLTDEYRGNEKMLKFGACAPAWMQGRNTRPVVLFYNLGEIGTEMRFMPFRYSVPERASYIPLPSYSGEVHTLRNIDPGLIMPLCQRLAEKIGNLF